MLIGAGCLLFIQGTANAIVVFQKKRGIMFMICLVGLFSGIILLMLDAAALFWGTSLKFIAIFATPFWYLTIQCASWAYCIRIRSMGVISKFDKFVDYTPWAILVFQIPANVLFILMVFNPEYQELYVIVSVIFSAAISVSEVFLYVVLLKKVLNILEYRRRVKNALSYEMFGSLILLIVLDAVLIVSKIMTDRLDIILRPFTYLLRIVIIIRFYDILLDGLLISGTSISAQMSESGDSVMPKIMDIEDNGD